MSAAIADDFGRIPMSPFLKAALARAADYASAQMHREVTLEHLLLALAEDPEASVVLKSSQVDIQRLMSDVSGYIGRNDDRVDGASPPAAISIDLRRILEASAAAASQGRRREINGAIVLAAIVGDGKSPAAHILRSQGLTFEQAIRALQQAANTQSGGAQGQPASQPAGIAPRADTADDVMALARERVLTRTAPPEPPAERREPPAERREPPAERREPPAERTQPPAERREPPAERREPPAERTLPPASAGIAAPQPAPISPMRIDPEAVQSAPQRPAPSTPVAGPTVDPMAGQMAQAQRHYEAPQPHATPSLSVPQPAPGWAPYPAAAAAAAAAASTPRHSQFPQSAPEAPRQGPFSPANGVRPPVGSPAPLPPFPPMTHSGLPSGLPSGLASGPRSAPPFGQAPAGYDQLPGGYGQQPQTAGRPTLPAQSAPWPEPGSQTAPRGPQYDDAMARLDARRPQQPPAGPYQGQPQILPHSQQPQAPQRRAPPTVHAGQLVENIPRRMRMGIPVIVEARVARADVKAIADGLQGDGAVYRHEVTVTKAMSVRLRAPDGGFYIETASPETQWIENVLGLMSNDYASWRWAVTARERGKRKLQLVISARTVGTDGLTAETALPDQVIDVTVGINVAKTLAKWGTWIGAAVAGGLLSRFGDSIFGFANALMGGSG